VQTTPRTTGSCSQKASKTAALTKMTANFDQIFCDLWIWKWRVHCLLVWKFSSKSQVIDAVIQEIFYIFSFSCWPLWRRFFNHYHIGRYIFKLPSSWIVYVQFHLWWTIVCFNVWLLLRLTMHLIFLIELLFLLVWQNKTQDIKSTEKTCRTFDCCFKRILKVGEWWVAL